jgi:ribosome-binding protein aMBF1 (putative translation factor)
MKSKNLENFEKLVSNEESGWLDKFSYYKTNKSWLDKSAMVAINVLEVLKAKGLSQKDLAEKMKVSSQQVNKILKGQQNLTLETISKLETALEISFFCFFFFK